MKQYFGFDFGTANTLIQQYNESMPEPIPVDLPGLANYYDEIPVIPSVIQFTSPDHYHIGAQIPQVIAMSDPQAFRWMKHYQLHRNPYTIQCGNSSINSTRAAETFIQHLFHNLAPEAERHIVGIGLSVPVDAYESYENWLENLAEENAFQSVHLIDEASAAAIGVGIQRFADQIVCVIDFGAGTLDISIVKFENLPEKEAPLHQRCLVLAKSAVSLGGLHIDQWLYVFLLNKMGLDKHDPHIKSISAALLKQCETIKIELSSNDSVTTQFSLDEAQTPFTIQISKTDFETLLDNNHFQDTIKQTIEKAIATLQLKGYDQTNISDILCVGGSSRLPAFIQLIQTVFVPIPISYDHPMDAVSRGAALFASGQSFLNHIQHDYALRYYNQELDEYQYRILVRKGTSYPSDGSLAELIIKATYDNQQRFGLAIYEISQDSVPIPQDFELFFDPQGAVQILPLTPAEQKERSALWLNEANPTFLYANEGVSAGEARFKVSFSLDKNKRLLLSSYDMIDKIWLVENHPVIRLS